MSDTWLSATASDLGRGIAAGDIDPVELTETYLNAAESHEFSSRIYTHVTRDRAMAEANAAKSRADMGLRRSLLDGVPISWKDLVDTAGIETKAGSDLLSGRVPQHDGECLASATRAGLVCMGKTHMSELAFSGLGVNPITATPPCVNNHDAAPGGSSSGAAASVAFNTAAAGIGSDTGGSVRIPSAWNDLVGLKTTATLVSLNGVVPLAESFDTIGPLCRSVEDAGHLLAAMTGGTAPDLKNTTLAGRHFAICKTSALDDVDPTVMKGFDATVAKLTAAGAKITELDIPFMPEALGLSSVLFTGEAYAEWKTEIEATPDVMFPEILERFRIGLNHSAVDYVRAQKRMMQLRREYNALTAPFDAVIAPTSPVMPPNVQRLETDSEYYQRVNLLALRNTRIGNLMGLCALTLPTDEKSVGLMALSAPFSEAKLLRIGNAMEAALRG
ncbi:amidase family protein [Amylibacter sp. IMCC11727]|uniref:amidase n=1 Tax=Amylibacter sp. IMCC11727 TaxID=3039851 RepID=UPI00244DB75B|nr:amidase family protein [Amylibacter sp. IMCC11727]WGI22212.1 amidase family protein [Amylibacter sp. IMCC11727]